MREKITRQNLKERLWNACGDFTENNAIVIGVCNNVAVYISNVLNIASRCARIKGKTANAYTSRWNMLNAVVNVGTNLCSFLFTEVGQVCYCVSK
jgi:phosphoribosylformylglycinamidine (FGAM) synthase-like amidotransferase family enzyme